MSENLKLQLAVLIKNSITLICFTVLSIIFKKWWIVFGAIIFSTFLVKDEGDEDDIE